MSTPSEMSQGGQLDLSMKGPHHNNTSSHLDIEDESDDEKSEGEMSVQLLLKYDVWLNASFKIFTVVILKEGLLGVYGQGPTNVPFGVTPTIDV